MNEIVIDDDQNWSGAPIHAHANNPDAGSIGSTSEEDSYDLDLHNDHFQVQ